MCTSMFSEHTGMLPLCTKMYLFVPGKAMCKLVCTDSTTGYVHVHTWLYLAEPCFTLFTGFHGALWDANTMVPDVLLIRTSCWKETSEGCKHDGA